MNQNEIAELILRIVYTQVPENVYRKEDKIITINDKIRESDLDSFGYVMVYIYLGDFFGIPQPDFDPIIGQDVSSLELAIFIDEHKTTIPSYEMIEDAFNK